MKTDVSWLTNTSIPTLSVINGKQIIIDEENNNDINISLAPTHNMGSTTMASAFCCRHDEY